MMQGWLWTFRDACYPCRSVAPVHAIPFGRFSCERLVLEAGTH